MKAYLFLLLFLLLPLVSAQDFATVNVPTTITTGCIQNGTLNSSSATIIIYNMSGGVVLPLTTEYQIAQGLYGVNITFTQAAKYITAETCNFNGTLVQGSEFIIVENPPINSTTDLLPLLNSISGVTNQTLNLTQLIYNNTQGILGNITQLQNGITQINSTVNSINTTLFFMNLSLQNINNNLTNITLTLAEMQTTINNIQSDVNSIQSDVNNLQSSMTQVKNNLTYLISLHLNSTDINFSNITAQLTSIQNSINQQNTSLTQINNTVNIILGNLTQHMQDENFSQNQQLSYLQNITINLTDIANAINGISINISSQNLTDLNNSITGFIIAENAKPRNYSIQTMILLLLIIMYVVSIFYHTPIFLFFTAMASIIGGFILFSLFGLWIVFVMLGIGVTYFVLGAKKM